MNLNKENEKKALGEALKGEAKTFWAKLGSFGREIRELSQRGEEEITRAFKIGKLKEKQDLLSQEREKKVKEFGAKVIHFIEEARITDPELIRLAEEIKKIETEKRATEEEIENARKR